MGSPFYSERIVDRDKLINRVMSKLSNTFDKHNQWVKDLAKKYKKLTPENAVAYAREWEKYHNFKVPANPKTKKTKEDGQHIIEVQLENNHWYPVWIDDKMGGLYGEY